MHHHHTKCHVQWWQLYIDVQAHVYTYTFNTWKTSNTGMCMHCCTQSYMHNCTIEHTWHKRDEYHELVLGLLHYATREHEHVIEFMPLSFAYNLYTCQNAQNWHVCSWHACVHLETIVHASSAYTRAQNDMFDIINLACICMLVQV